QGEMARFDLNTLDPDFLRRLILRPITRGPTCAWIDQGRLNPNVLGLEFLKALAYHPDWAADPGLTALRTAGPTWARARAFEEPMADRVLGWLRDVRRFAPADLGFDWLLKLAARSEPRYHTAAVDIMIKGFIPADFAPTAPATTTPTTTPAAPVAV